MGSYQGIPVLEEKKIHLLDILNLSSNQHAAVNILTEVKVCVSQRCFKWSAIKCCVTASPSTMTKLRSKLHDKRPHIVMLSCALHMFNLLAKDLCRYIHAKCIVKTNCMLVNFFTSLACVVPRVKGMYQEQ